MPQPIYDFYLRGTVGKMGEVPDNREFVAMAKRYAVDDAIEQMVQSLTTISLPKETQDAKSPVEQSISAWINKHALAKRRRSEWFQRLSKEEQRMLKDILEDCAERVGGNFFALIDGVGGSYDGVFEIVAINSEDDRIVLNPENTEMLHNLFSEICEQDREQREK